MELEDLRIGNKILYLGRIITITGIHWRDYLDIIYWYSNTEDKELCANLNNFHPINITDELLVKIGFSKKQTDFVYRDFELVTRNGVICISNVSNTACKKYSVRIKNLNHAIIACMDIEYLHELQNFVWDCIELAFKI
jgi:hypothetical protein